MEKLYRIYYIFLVLVALIFGIALYQSYNEKEELKHVLFNSYSKIIKTAINKFIEVKNHHETISEDMVEEFMKDLEFNYKDFEVKFLFKSNKNKLTEELKYLPQLKTEGFYKTFGIWDRTYYIPIRDKAIKERYKSLFLADSDDIIGVLVFSEDEDKMDNIGGNIEENFDGKVGLFVFVYFILALLGYIFLKMAKRYFTIIEENQQLEIEKEVAKKNEQLKSEFLANMSHEIRTPLNAMFGFIHLLEAKNIDKESKEYLKIIKNSGEILLSLINDILDFSKVEAGKMVIEKYPFNLKTEIMKIYTLFSNKAATKNIKLSLIEKNIDIDVVSDSVRIKQVISNLLSNAIKFTPENKNIKLYVAYNDEKEELYVEVKDEGIGIPKDKLNTIFKPFSQADNSTTRKYGGTGLGLTISYNLIELLGGKLEVESEVDKGSRFCFSIPLKKSDIQQNKDDKSNSKDVFKYHILLVEDNQANIMFVSVLLKKLGITFDVANDGVEAVDIYKSSHHKYDCILMDENMPNMTGSEATKCIRAFEKEIGIDETFIIALTANALDGDRERFLEVGMNEYLSKPLDIEKLKEILRNLRNKI